MEAAFAAGASMVEIDLHATSDGRFAVFHDHGLECRTNGVGAPEGHPMDTLRRLDVGYSYTADGGATYPLRGGPGVGAMPELGDVFDRFPEGGFVLHVKRGNVEDGERLVARLVALSPEATAADLGLWRPPTRSRCSVATCPTSGRLTSAR
jgi:glycerophosphoryl diester phosphodiesterase